MSDRQAKIEAIEQEIKALQVLLLELQAESETPDHEYWIRSDIDASCEFRPLWDIGTALQENRAGRYYTAIKAEFTSSFLTILPGDSINHEEMVMEAYEKAQGRRLFYTNYSREGGYMLKPGTDEFNRLIWAGNAGPKEARERFEAYWTAPDALERTQEKADQVMAYLDRKYETARLKPDSLLRFNARYPHYEPE